jgi:hypothetical protein
MPPRPPLIQVHKDSSNLAVARMAPGAASAGRLAIGRRAGERHGRRVWVEAYEGDVPSRRSPSPAAP